MAWDDLRGYVDQVAYLAYLSGMPGGECLVVCQAAKRREESVQHIPGLGRQKEPGTQVTYL